LYLVFGCFQSAVVMMVVIANMQYESARYPVSLLTETCFIPRSACLHTDGPPEFPISSRERLYVLQSWNKI